MVGIPARRAESNRKTLVFPFGVEMEESNLRPYESKSYALPTELISQVVETHWLHSVHALQWLASARQAGIQRTRTAE